MATRAFCIHGHFYQPPREDPLTGVIPSERGAAPFTNWNERIHAECYRPNADLGNFEHISYNIGPTLHRWMAAYDFETYARIIAQDRMNVRRYHVGNAIAQAYNHTILPLGTTQDKITQIYWGIADFKLRFGRAPQGMWLPETAVDYETLEVLTQQGIQFTILAPWQARYTGIDPTQPYQVILPRNRKITIFFYQSELSAQISFDPQSTTNADLFASRYIQSAFNLSLNRQKEPQILLFASDGELYGHHQPMRDRFLAHLVNGASSRLGITPTFPALWLKSHPARQNIEIHEQTSWSCHHGVARWKGSCPCTPENGEWKIYLRFAFERLASALDQLFFEVTSPYFRDPWQLRNRYIYVILKQMSLEDLVAEMASRALTSEETRQIGLLLEMQRERQRMFTSCGWFFEDFDRIEPQNNVAYAAHAVRLARLATGVDLEATTSEDLKRVISQYSRLSADAVFIQHLRRAEVPASQVLAY